ncbi:MAG: biopolymer transporter ExbD [endosymbiont of Galathealinum brachiosum]|uniref:Biopolymer transporter ExbD n=1 Tax=endosymbiont of Galathealinum brachiosum TaxID=2200906 RepID=A0A370DH07_9GAMM|nr:MAG: biopolymer transporter ExbD [endosymbiont of Galathealinum brachiosum]
MKLVRRKHKHQDVELNITAFLNLMVILIPFLLITAVFSRVTVLELNLPSKNSVAKQEEKIKLQLELVVRKDSFEIRDANLGRIKYLARTDGKTNWKMFTDILVEIKARFPEEQSITLLLEPKINYKTLIKVMDRVRYADVVQIVEVVTVELFPNVSIGDAPELLVSAPVENSPVNGVPTK